MAELLIKIGDNFPHKDLMLSLKTTDATAKQTWIEREAEKLLLYPQEIFTLDGKTLYDPSKLDDRILVATLSHKDKVHACWRHLDVVKARPDGWQWGMRESFPRFYIVRIPDSDLFLHGYAYIGPTSQLKIQRLQHDLKTIIDIDAGETSLIHRAAFALNSDAGLFGEGITEISFNQLRLKTEYEEYDPAKAQKHNSAGTYTIKSSGGSYTDLTNWEAGEQCDLTADGGQGCCIAECYNDWPNGLSDHLSINGWTTDSSNYAKVYTPTTQRHSGKAKSGGNFTGFAVKTDVGGLYTGVLYAHESYTVLDGIIVDADSRGYVGGVRVYHDIGSTVSNCIIINVSETDFFYPGIYTPTAGQVCNNIIHDCAGWGIDIRDYSGSTLAVYNNTIIGGTTGIGKYSSAGSGGKVVNNICHGQSTKCFDWTNITTVPGYNASSDDTADNNGGSGNRESQTFTFVDADNDDYHLDGDDAGARGYGVGPSSDGNVPTTDIDGDSRSGTTCDIGADEYVASGGSTINFSMTIAAASAVSSIAVAVTRSLAASIAAESTAGDIAVSVERRLAAAIDAVSALSEISVPVARQLSATIAVTSAVSEALAVIDRTLSTNISAESATAEVALAVIRSLAMSIAAESATSSPAAAVLRELSASIEAGSTVNEALVTVASELSMTIGAESAVSAIALILGALGIIVDPSLTSLTPERTFDSATPIRTFQSATPRREIIAT